MSVQTPIAAPDGTFPIAKLRAYIIGPAVAKALHAQQQDAEMRVPYRGIIVSDVGFGLDATGMYCPLCTGTFLAPCFAYECNKTSALWREEQRIGDDEIVMHTGCVRMAEDSGLTLDAYFERLDQDAREVAQIIERGDA